MCSALGLLNRGRSIKYTSCAMLVQDLLIAKRDLRLSREIKKLASHDGRLSTKWAMSNRAGTRWRSCSLYWPNATNAAAFC